MRLEAVLPRVAWWEIRANAILPLMADSDAQAIAAVRQGEVDRFAELVERYQAQAIRLAYTFLGNYEDARDVSQDAFVSAYRALAGFRGGAKFSTWLYRIVINKCKDAYKRRARQLAIAGRVGVPESSDDESFFIDVDDPSAGPSEQLVNRELGSQLTQAIRELPMQQQTAFLLHHVHGLALEAAAEVMGCRIGTVKGHIFRATESLRQRLTPWLTEER